MIVTEVEKPTQSGIINFTAFIVPQKTAEYEYGTVVELTTEPADGYTFAEWEGALTSSENPVQITMNGPKEITAVFEREILTITTHTTGEGTVFIIPDQEEYEYGTTVALFAEPDENWAFVEWQGDVSSTENPLETTVDGTTFTKRTADQTTSSNTVTTCTSGITDMSELFRDTDFNKDISHWDVSKVTDMEFMFYYAGSFNQNINSWCVENISSEPTDFSHDSLLTENHKPAWGTCPE